MESLYHQTNSLLEQTHSCFARLERAVNAEESQQHEKEIQALIDQITSNCERLDVFVSKEPPTRRQNAKYRVDQLKYDNQHLQAALRNVQYKRYSREQQQYEREELLSRQFNTNDAADTSIFIDHSLQHNTALHNAHRGIDDLIGSGSSALSNLRDQRSTLKNAHKRILDLANTLGLSNTVMRLIERRAKEDKYILLIGVIVTCIVMILVIWYLA